MNRFSFIALLFISATLSTAQQNQDTLFCKVSGSIRTPQEADRYVEKLTEGCSLGCAMGWTIQASSTLAPQAGASYSIDNVSDADLHTAWVEGVPGYGIGEKLMISFQSDRYEGTIPFWGLEFVNGYTKSRNAWEQNSRVSLLNVLHNGKRTFSVRLVDTDQPQDVYFDDPFKIPLAYGDTITLEIADVYPGKKYKDTAITEINLHGAH